MLMLGPKTTSATFHVTTLLTDSNMNREKNVLGIKGILKKSHHSFLRELL